VGTNITGDNCRLETYPLPKGSNANTALSNHQQGAITSDPRTPLASSGIVGTLVVAVKELGNFLVNQSFSYEASTGAGGGTPQVLWQLVRRTGAFLVNGVAPTPGFFLFPTDTGGTATTLMSTANTFLNGDLEGADAHHLHALDISGQPVGALVAYDLIFTSGIPLTTISFPNATPSNPLGQFSVLEVL
jgi:hypothetical protein